MFGFLPTITDENLNAVVAKEIDRFQDLLERCTKETSTPNDALNYLCAELFKTNPNLAKAVIGACYCVFKELEENCSPEIAWAGGLATAPGVLAALRLIDRALEAQQMESKMASNGGENDSSTIR